MFKGKMKEQEFNERYRALGFESVHDVCIEMRNETELPIDTDHVRTQLKRFGQLSRWQTAAFRVFFRKLEGEMNA